MITGCDHEQDVLDAIAANRWPNRLSAALSRHVSACEVCQDLGIVAAAISDDYASAALQARLPSAGLVYWRAEIRARQQARLAASQPITLVQLLTTACGFAVALSLLTWSGFRPLPAIRAPELWAAFTSQPFFFPLLLLSVGVLAIFSAAAVYLALSDE
jgi:hypothetical protein